MSASMGFGTYRSVEGDDSVSSGNSFLMHDSASSQAWGQPEASDTAGRMLLALAAFQEVIHVMEVGWRVRLGSSTVMWRLKLHCYDASELLKGPGLPGLRGEQYVQPDIQLHCTSSREAPQAALLFCEDCSHWTAKPCSRDRCAPEPATAGEVSVCSATSTWPACGEER